MTRLMIALVVGLALPASAQQRPQEQPQDKSISARTAGLQKLEGYVPLYWDAATGKMLMEVSRFNTEFLYQISLTTGVGSNPLGLDRGQLGRSHVVRFERIGPRVLLTESNYSYRAISTDPAERRAVQESFAQSVLWGFKVEASEGDRVLVDATSFFLRDAHGVIDRLRQARQGQYRLDESRSAFFLPRTKAFPKNTEVETVLTFSSEGETGPMVRDTVPSPQSITIREHHSLVELPDNNYKPRNLDPRVGSFGITFYDFASPLNEPVEKRWISRHRLQKKDPTAAISEPVKPIVYYVDNGAPEPVRSALIEGASWWNAAFEAAGFKNAFQVKVLPEDADPMDLRYNMINWVHRSTRGWSYGGGVTDPRTGEIIKGNVTLGSLRDRQDYLIGSGLIPLFAMNGKSDGEGECELGSSPDPDYLADLDPSTDSVAMALARLRQLSAHETGHTLGLAHNFAASTYGRASVMDYPAPTVEIKNGKLDLSNAYAVGIGAYDKFVIKYSYTEFAPGANETAELERIVEEGVAAGMLFITDADARPPGAAHPLASLWDNGADPIAELRHEMDVRRIGLSQFGLGNIPVGTPLSVLEAKLLPLYLHHRYQLQAAVKSVGGVFYTYAVKTASGANPGTVQQIVEPARQREALAAVLETIKVDALAIPPRILELIPPRAFGYEGGTAELFSKRTDPMFDPIAAAVTAADLAVSALLEPHRAARLIDFHSRTSANPDFKEVVDALIGATWKAPAPRAAYHAEIARGVQSLAVNRLMELAANPDAPSQVRAVATQALRELGAWLKLPASAGINAAHRSATREDIERFLTRPDATRKQTAPLNTPPGDPIGAKGSRNQTELESEISNTMPYADNSGVKIYWEEQGVGDPLILIMGLGYTHDMWHRTLPVVSQRYRTISFDNRGVGRSDVPPGPYLMATMAADAATVMDSAGVDRAHVFGVSMGGMIAQEFALHYPERVRSLILGCTSHGGPEAVAADAEVISTAMTRGLMSAEDGIRAMIPFIYDQATPRERVEEDLEIRRRTFPTAEGYFAQIQGIVAHDSLSRLSQLKVPTLVIHGESDRLVPPENGRRLARLIDGAKLVMIPGASHIFPTDQPEVSHQAILSFLEGQN